MCTSLPPYLPEISYYRGVDRWVWGLVCFIASPRETKIQQSFYHSPNTTYNSASKIHSCQEGFAGLLYVAIRPACLLMSGRVGCVGRAWSGVVWWYCGRTGNGWWWNGTATLLARGKSRAHKWYYKYYKPLLSDTRDKEHINLTNCFNWDLSKYPDFIYYTQDFLPGACNWYSACPFISFKEPLPLRFY